MKWLSLFVALLGLLRYFLDFLERRRLIEQAEAQAVRNALDDAKSRMDKVRAASAAARASGVPDDSIFRD